MESANINTPEWIEIKSGAVDVSKPDLATIRSVGASGECVKYRPTNFVTFSSADCYAKWLKRRIGSRVDDVAATKYRNLLKSVTPRVGRGFQKVAQGPRPEKRENVVNFGLRKFSLDYALTIAMSRVG